MVVQQLVQKQKVDKVSYICCLWKLNLDGKQRVTQELGTYKPQQDSVDEVKPSLQRSHSSTVAVS